jgi:tyrosyl-tRNA synthetase
MPDNLFDVLTERGFVAQSTEPPEAMRQRLAAPVSAYIGFDPTADSLHVGSLVPIMGLYWLQQCGHRPLVVVGGATALVGDPSGKTEMRKMLTREDIDRNAVAIARQIERIVRFDASPTGAKLLNNADWLAELNWITLLREVGPHFSVNRMLSMDSVKGRLEGNGISFLEFNYMVMQALDFVHLHQAEACSLQMGGQDQWGNIVMGIELGRRRQGVELAGLTFPLVTKSDGGKFGKSEKGNIWLSEKRTPPYEFYQFWRNAADADVRRFLGFFTTVPMAEVDRLTATGELINEAKELLAVEVTKLVHGAEAAEQALQDSRKAFGADRDVTGDSIPHGEFTVAELEAGVGLLAALVRAKLAASNGEARRLVEGGGVRVHERVVKDHAEKLGTRDVVDGYVLLRAGKKRMYRFDVT